MKHFTLAIIFAALAGSQALRAQAGIPVEQLCRYANSRTLSITKPDGESVEGTCFSVTKDEVRVQTAQGVVAIAKAQLNRVHMYELKPRHQIAGLGKWMGRGVKDGAEMIPTAFGPVGLIKVGLTLAAGAVASPFAGIGDLLGYSKSIEVRIQ